MAKVQMLMPDDFLEKLSKLGKKTDEITKEVLKAGGEVALAKVKSNLDAVIGRGLTRDSRSTGELQKALGVSPPLLDRNGNYNVTRSVLRKIVPTARATPRSRISSNTESMDSRRGRSLPVQSAKQKSRVKRR